jgi:MipA family protein
MLIPSSAPELRCVAMFRVVIVALSLLLSSLAAQAQIDRRSPEQRAAPDTWNITVGARVAAQPRFIGSKDMEFAIRPQFSMGRGLGSRWLTLEDDNISIGLINGDRWRLGVTGRLVWSREEKSSRVALAGLGNTRFGGEAGAFAEFYPTEWLRARVDLRQGFVAHRSLMADLKLDAFTRLGNGWTIAAGPRVSFAGGDYMDRFFGVNAAQAALSGLPQYNPRSGLLSYGVAAQVGYKWNARVETVAFVQYSRLAAEAARAPLVVQRGSRDQVTVGVSTRWTIDTGR